MKFFEFSVRNTLLGNLLTVFVLAAGTVAVFSIQREVFPQVSFDEVTISTVYPGASADDIEKFNTTPLEKEIKSVSGIKEFNSRSEEGFSLIGVTIDPKEKDKKQVVTDIQRAVDNAADLPIEADEPIVTEITSKEIPFLEISLSGDLPEKDLRRLAESLEDQILDIPAVANTLRIGWRDREFWVEVDPAKLNELHVSLTQVMAALNSRNIAIPGGEIRTSGREFTVRTSGEFKTVEDIEKTVLRVNDAGITLQIKDFAKVIDTFEDEDRIARVNGRRALAMVVRKKEMFDVIKAADAVKATVADFEKILPANAHITLSNDFSYYTKRRLGVLQSNGLQGFVIVILILLLFMEPIPALATALGIPFALLLTLRIMHTFGLTINLVSMVGLIIVLGMLVDDGIVTSENTYRYIEDGMPPRQAAIKGPSEVFSPILGGVVTTWAAFFPLLFMHDMIGKFIWAIPVVVIVALAASLLECFFILPGHLSEWVIYFREHSFFKKYHRPKRQWLINFTEFYLRILKSSLQFRYQIAAGLVFAFVASILLMMFHMKVILFTGEGTEEFLIRAEAAMGTPLADTEKLILPIEELVESLPKNELSSYRTFIGSIENETGFDKTARRGTHLAQITVFLTPYQERQRKPAEIIDALRPKLEKIQGLEKVYFYLSKEGPPTGSAVSVSVRGENFSIIKEIAEKFKSSLEKKTGVKDIVSSYNYGKQQLNVVIDEVAAGRYMLTTKDIAATVRAAIRGAIATKVKPNKADEETNVLVRFVESARNKKDVFAGIFVENTAGNLVPLSSVASIQEQKGIYQINHLDGKRVITISADVDIRKSSSQKVNEDLQNEFKNIANQYPGYSIKYGGEFEDQQESQRNLMFSFLFALFFIFIILTQEFKSMTQLFLVLLTIPFGIMGVPHAFFLHGRPISSFALLGVVGLAGVGVNSAIVLLDCINRLRIDGMGIDEALIQAGRLRIRPVLMTSTTTIGGLLSVAYGIGGGDPFLKPLGLALVWGLFFATALTLVAIPCLYKIFDDLSQKILHHSLVKINDADKEILDGA